MLSKQSGAVTVAADSRRYLYPGKETISTFLLARAAPRSETLCKPLLHNRLRTLHRHVHEPDVFARDTDRRGWEDTKGR